MHCQRLRLINLCSTMRVCAVMFAKSVVVVVALIGAAGSARDDSGLGPGRGPWQSASPEGVCPTVATGVMSTALYGMCAGSAASEHGLMHSFTNSPPPVPAHGLSSPALQAAAESIEKALPFRWCFVVSKSVRLHSCVRYVSDVFGMLQCGVLARARTLHLHRPEQQSKCCVRCGA
jgi:hypothetical protein